MRFIDERGRLFGKVNVIDFLFILFFLIIIPMFIFGYKLFMANTAREKEELKKESIDIQISGKFIKVNPEILKLITIGDKGIGDNGEITGEITQVGESKPYQYIFDLGDEQILIKEQTTLKELYVNLRLKIIPRGSFIFYNQQRIASNSPIIFKTAKYALEFIPVKEEIKKKQREIKSLDLYVTLKRLDEKIVKLISAGDKEINEKGEVIAEILSIGKIENDAYEIDLGDRNFVIGEDSDKKQVSIKMRLNAAIREDKQLYFKGTLITYNSWIELRTDKYSVIGKIARTYEAMPQPIKERWLQVQVKFSGIIPEVANMITEGDIEKDASGKITARLLKIASNKSSEVFTLKEDRLITIAHPFYKDIIAVFDFLCVEKEGILYFKNYPVKMGNAASFSTDLYSLSGTIISIKTE